MSFYDQIGGAETFQKISARFYEQVAADPVMSEMYPEEDLGPAEERLRMFLEQYWGGPTTYSDTRGHPRLRMRHQPYAVTPEARDTWLKRSEEHTSELQSRGHLVCRLLLEKKKRKRKTVYSFHCCV